MPKTIYSVQTPDGEIMDIEGPDDATDEQIAAFAASQFSAPRGSAGAPPEPVATRDVPAADPAWRQAYLDSVLAPRSQRPPDTMAALRGFGDTMLLNYADEIGSAIESGQLSGPEFDAVMAENAALRAADDPNARGAGELLGMLGSALVPAGAAGRVAGMGKQMLTGAGTGAAMSAVSGSGANAGDRTATLGQDALIGTSAGLVAPVLASTLRKGAQVVGVNPQSAAEDALIASGLPTGEAARTIGPHVVDSLTTRGASKLTGPLNRSEKASQQVIDALQAEREALAPGLTQQIMTGPTTSGSRAVATIPSTGGPSVPGSRTVQGPDAILKARDERADIEYGAFRDVPIDTSGPTGLIIEDAIKNSTLTSLGKDTVMAAIDRGKFTAGQLTKLRQNLYARARSKPGEGYKEIADQIDDILGEQVPGAETAINNFRRASAAAEGAEFGVAAARKTQPIQTREAIARLEPDALVGVPSGTRVVLVEDAVTAPSASYALAKKLEESPGYQAQLRQLLPDPGEADQLIAFAIQQKKSIDNLGALAKLPQKKLETLLDDTEEMTNAIAAAGFGVGGAFKAAVARTLLSRALPIGEKAADNLAAMLLDPKMRNKAVAVLEKAGLPRQGVRELVQGAFISAANTLATAGRQTRPPPEGFGNRADGTAKGNGFLGPMMRPDGKVSTEISIGVNIDGQEVEIPTMVPGLTPDELDFLLTTPPGGDERMPGSIVQKAVEHARRRIALGQSPFAQPGESPPQ